MAESLFVDLMDELIRTADDDLELADGIKWLDVQAQKRGISFYDMAFEVLYRCDRNTPQNRWLGSRN